MSGLIYNIIGDIHGRNSWKKLVDDNAINVFVGDYFDPYNDGKPIPFNDVMDNFMDIMVYASNHKDNVILLLGNHDYCPYVVMCEQYSRYIRFHAKTIHDAFIENSDLFTGFAYSIGDKYLVTHAGLSKYWWRKRSEIEIPTPKEAETVINELYKDGTSSAFTFEDNSDIYDTYGDSLQQSPIWIRPQSLAQANVWVDVSTVTQIVGHTQFRTGLTKVTIDQKNDSGKLIFIDCLGQETSCVRLEEQEDGSFLEFTKTYNETTGETTITPLENLKR